jgi:hypothetical protein
MRILPIGLWLSAAVLIGIPQAVNAGTATYRMSATVIHNGAPRSDGAIQVGDTLRIWLHAPGTTVTSCRIFITTAGGDLMSGAGNVSDGDGCGLELVLPQLPNANFRDELGDDFRYARDVCIGASSLSFGDGTTRVMDAADRLQPGGVQCHSPAGGDEEVLDLFFDGSGEPKAFSSTPNILSWNISDWDADYVPFRFNTDWSVSLPDWITWCGGPYLNGSWVTSYEMGGIPDESCSDWNLRLPGVLPSTVPWDGGPGSWDVSFVFSYRDDLGRVGWMISDQSVPYEPSDGIFRSSLPAVAPTDLSAARFVTVGEAWRPEFQGAGPFPPLHCWLYWIEAGVFHDWLPGAIGDDGKCRFDMPALPAGEYRQYAVHMEFDGPEAWDPGADYAGSIYAVAAPASPIVGDALSSGDGGTHVSATYEAANGLALSLTLKPSSTTAVNAKSAASARCAATSYADNFESGGVISTTKKCVLKPGRYVIRARAVDVTGKVRVKARTVTVAGLDGAGQVTSNLPATTASARGQSIKFVYAAGAGGMYLGQVRLIVPAGWSAPTLEGMSPGYVEASMGTIAVVDRTIIVSGLTRSTKQRLTLTYGSTASGGPGATAPSAAGNQEWRASQKAKPGGKLRALRMAPRTRVYAANGSGSMVPSMRKVAHGAKHKTITFSYTPTAGGMRSGEVRLRVPASWSAPSVNTRSSGYVSSSAGLVTISGRTIVVRGLTRSAGHKVVIVYGSTAGGGPGARAPDTAGLQVWRAWQKSIIAGELTPLAQSPAINVK